MPAYAGMVVGSYPLSGASDTCCKAGNLSWPFPTGRSAGANAVGVGTTYGYCRCMTTPGPSEHGRLRLQWLTVAPVLPHFM